MKAIGRDRIGNDKFYTKKEIANECCNILKKKGIIENGDLIIEPSAGDGSFIDGIKSLSKKYKFFDIEPNHKEITGADFLTINEFDNTKKIHFLGNPPFGRQSSIAKKFIKHCSLYGDSISFILPKSFKKESLQKTFPLCFHLIHEHDLPNNSFTIDGFEHNVPCIFQIWIKKNINRIVKEKEDPLYFKFVKKEENPDISFRRVGVYAGEINIKYNDKSESSHYFIKFTNPKILSFLDNFKTIVFCDDNTVGPKSISKPELIFEFNRVISNISQL